MRLTDTEKTILDFALQGIQYKEISNKSGKGLRVVRFHLSNIYKKFGVQSKLELMAAFIDKEKYMKRFLVVLLVLLPLKVYGQTHSAAIAWTQPTQQTGETIVSTNVYRNGSLLKNVPVATLSYTDTTVASGTTYSYAVSNIDSSMKESVLSTAVPATIPGNPPPPPPPATCGNGGANVTSLTLNNNAPSVTFTIWDSCPDAEPATVVVNATAPFTSGNITLSTTNGDTAFAETATLAPGSLAAGTYKAAIVATSTAWTNKSISIPVTITITAPPKPISINCQAASVGVSNLPLGSYTMTVKSGSSMATCTATH